MFLTTIAYTAIAQVSGARINCHANCPPIQLIQALHNFYPVSGAILQEFQYFYDE